MSIEVAGERRPRRIAASTLLVLALVALAFQQSPGNETVRANGAFRVLQETDSEVAAGLMVFGLTMLIEGVTSILIAAGFAVPGRQIQNRLARFRSRIAGRKSADESWAARLTDTGITLGLGPGLVVVRRHFQEPARRFRQDLRTLTGYCVLGSVVSGVIGYLVAGGARHAHKVGLGTPAAYFVDWAADWRFWTALLGTGYALNWAAKRLRSSNISAVKTPTQPTVQPFVD